MGIYFWAVAQTERGGGGVLDIDIFWRGDICNMSYLVSLMLSFRDSAHNLNSSFF